MAKTFPLAEIEEAFRNYYLTGIIYEDWVAWSKLFTDDATYHDHFWGTFTGPAEVEKFLETTMSGSAHVYAALEWYTYREDGRLIYKNSNRADHPIPEKGWMDFPSLQVIQYAGDGKWSSEEDWWVMYDMVRFRNKYNAALEEAGTPDFAATLSRRDFGDWVDWARPSDLDNYHPKPSW
ncbi:MAG: hypothetical protein JWL64_1606, partial [Frankiales bacterium]|nr:hypothetical protein [Frankiales bacterium]